MNNEYMPNYVSSPWDTALEIIEEKYTDDTLANFDKLHNLIYYYSIINKDIDDNTADFLFHWTEVSQEFWLNREKQYRDSILN